MAVSLESRIDEPGLTSDQAAALLAEVGPNQLVPPTRRAGILNLLWRSLRDPMVLLLAAAAAIYVATGDVVDAVVTGVALVPIAAVGVILEGRSQRALDRLRALTAPTASALRDGEYRHIPAFELVPGDVISLREGDVVPADANMLDGANVACDESAMTGEAMPVEKSMGDDRALLAGTTLVTGRGTFLVTSTGGRTEYGRVGRLVAEVKQPPTPLERLVRRFTSRLLVVALVFCVLVAVVELLRGRGLAAGLIAGVSLAIAAVPEEFPMVYTLYLALGAWRLARRNALVRRLGGVEGLGAASVICTDKTGTLTTGRPAVAVLEPVPDGAASGTVDSLLEAALLAAEEAPFDPLDVAIHDAARERGIDSRPRKLVRDYGFDARARYMSHVWRADGGYEVAAKGALEGILDRAHASTSTRAAAESVNGRLARDGMRVLAVAHGHLTRLGSRHEDEQHLRFAGLVAFADPLRAGVREAITECAEAGIRVIMITGDHPATAQALAAKLGIHGSSAVATGADIEAADRIAAVAATSNVFARVRPEQKYLLVRELRRNGAIVAMTGDGINDAPALREADIGVAMGKRGTEVAREAATLVLLDDNFATIVAAVREGRRIFGNLQKAFAYLVAFHMPLLLTAFLVPLLGAPLLLLPVHLVLLELFIHPVVSLVFEDAPAPPSVMHRQPRSPSQFLLGRGEILRSSAQGAVLAAAVMALYVWRLSSGEVVDEARASAFVALVLGQIALLVIERTRPKSIWSGMRDFGRNSTVVVVATVALALVICYLPFAAEVLKLVPLSVNEWIYAVAVAIGATAWAEPLKLVARRPAGATSPL